MSIGTGFTSTSQRHVFSNTEKYNCKNTEISTSTFSKDIISECEDISTEDQHYLIVPTFSLKPVRVPHSKCSINEHNTNITFTQLPLNLDLPPPL